MRKFWDTVISTTTGKPISGAQVRVKDSAGDLATLYSDDGGTALANPVTTDANGLYEFYAENGSYDFEFLFGGEQLQTLTDVEISEDVTALQLASDDGASLVWTKDDDPSAVAMPTIVKLRQRLDAVDYLPRDHDDTMTTPYTSGLQSAVNKALSSGRKLRLPSYGLLVDGDGLLGASGLYIEGEGHQRSFIKSASLGSVFRGEGTHLFLSDLTFWSTGGGPVILQTGLLARSQFEQVQLLQDGPDNRIIDGAGYEWVANTIRQSVLQHVTNSTVSAVDLVSTGVIVNDNDFFDIIAQNSGSAHFFNIESTNADGTQSNNNFERIKFEVCKGGGVRLRGGQFRIVGNKCWDAQDIVNDFYDIDGNASGIACLGTIADCSRQDSTFAAGKYDVALPAGGLGAGIRVEQCYATGSTFTIDARGNGVWAVLPLDSQMAFINGSGVSYVHAFGGSINAASEVRVGGAKVVGARGAGIADAMGGSVVDVEARAAVNALLARLRPSTGPHGLIDG